MITAHLEKEIESLRNENKRLRGFLRVCLTALDNIDDVRQVARQAGSYSTFRREMREILEEMNDE